MWERGKETKCRRGGRRSIVCLSVCYFLVFFDLVLVTMFT